MFDLYQYLLRFGVARLAKWKPDFLHPDVFARAVKQIRRIPWGGRAASPTDRLTVPATNHTQPTTTNTITVFAPLLGISCPSRCVAHLVRSSSHLTGPEYIPADTIDPPP